MSLAKIKALSQLIMIAVLPLMTSCLEIPAGSKVHNDLGKMRQAKVKIGTKAEYTVYIADTDETRQVGLMNVTEEELSTDRGMLFVFESDELLSFWMRNTIIPLDIAFIRSDGLIVATYTMEPLTDQGYPSVEAAQFALEVRAGQFAEHGVVRGDRVQIPADIVQP